MSCRLQNYENTFPLDDRTAIFMMPLFMKIFFLKEVFVPIWHMPKLAEFT